jgi:tetratricopeptide (TPR) repeat protein
MSSFQPHPLPRAAAPGLAQDLLAALLSLKGRTTEAITQRRAALEKLEAILGPDHPELQPCLELLAIDLLRLEDFEAAAPILERTYRYRAGHLGPEHPETLERLAQLTECLLSAGLPAAAQPLLQDQLLLSERLLGPEHEDTLSAVQLLARAHHEQGDRASAETLLRRAQAGFECTLGSTHPKSLASLHALFENLAEGPDSAAAGTWGDKLLSTSQQVHGFSHPLTVSAATLVANFHVRRKDFPAAVAVLRRAVDTLPVDKTPITLEQAQLQSRLAACLDLAGQIDEAEVLARSAAYALHKHLGLGHAETERAYRHVADLSNRRSLRTPWGRFRLRCLRMIGRLLSFSR